MRYEVMSHDIDAGTRTAAALASLSASPACSVRQPIPVGIIMIEMPTAPLSERLKQDDVRLGLQVAADRRHEV